MMTGDSDERSQEQQETIYFLLHHRDSDHDSVKYVCLPEGFEPYGERSRLRHFPDYVG